MGLSEAQSICPAEGIRKTQEPGVPRKKSNEGEREDVMDSVGRFTLARGRRLGRCPAGRGTLSTQRYSCRNNTNEKINSQKKKNKNGSQSTRNLVGMKLP